MRNQINQEHILTDMTNCIERFGMRWKEKSLTIVAGVYTEYKPGDSLEIFSERARRCVWTVAEGMLGWALCSTSRVVRRRVFSQDLQG